MVEPEEAVAGDLISGALNPMMSALRTLDECDSPGDIGAHLDLAIARLREHLGLQAIMPPGCSSQVSYDRLGANYISPSCLILDHLLPAKTK